MAQEVRIGVLSFAHGHQAAWCQVFAGRPDARVVAIWDDDESRGRKQATALGVEYFRDVDALLRRSDIDAVTICAENVKHADLAVAAARAGKHIMMQKPMATTVEDAGRIVAAVKKAGVKYMQAHNLRFDPLHVMIKQVVDSGRIGRISVVRRRHSHHFAIDPGDLRRILWWMADPALSGGGALMDEGAHATLWFIWMFGYPQSVTARMSTVTPGLPVEDNALLLFEFAGNIMGSLQTSWTEPAGESTIEIFGDKGAIVATGTDIASSRTMPEQTPPLRIYSTDTGRWEYPGVELIKARTAPPPNAFVDCIVNDTPSPVPVEEAAMAVHIAVGAYRSARSGQTVPLPLS